MVMINRATKEITLKIVYYGPGLCGKTTNLEHIYATANPEKKGKLLTVATETDRTLFFDFLPVELGRIRGMKVRVQLYTVPGQVFYDATRRIVLRGSDGVVFVADSQRTMLDADVESLENLKANLKLNNLDGDAIPLVFQYNKRDLSDLLSPEEMDGALNWRKVPYFLSVATVGTGVNETLRKIIEQVIRRLQEQEEAMRASTKMKDGKEEVSETQLLPAMTSPPAEPAPPPAAEAAPVKEAEPPAPVEVPSEQEAPPGEQSGSRDAVVPVQVQTESITPEDELEVIDLDAHLQPPPVAEVAAPPIPVREVEITSSLPVLEHVQVQEQPAVQAPSLVSHPPEEVSPAVIPAEEPAAPPPKELPAPPAPEVLKEVAAPTISPPVAAQPAPDMARLRQDLDDLSVVLGGFARTLELLTGQVRELGKIVDKLKQKSEG